MIKTAAKRRGFSSAQPEGLADRAGSSADPARRKEALPIKLNPDAIRPAHRLRARSDEDPERWDGLS